MLTLIIKHLVTYQALGYFKNKRMMISTAFKNLGVHHVKGINQSCKTDAQNAGRQCLASQLPSMIPFSSLVQAEVSLGSRPPFPLFGHSYSLTQVGVMAFSFVLLMALFDALSLLVMAQVLNMHLGVHECPWNQKCTYMPQKGLSQF